MEKLLEILEDGNIEYGWGVNDTITAFIQIDEVLVPLWVRVNRENRYQFSLTNWKTIEPFQVLYSPEKESLDSPTMALNRTSEAIVKRLYKCAENNAGLWLTACERHEGIKASALENIALAFQLVEEYGAKINFSKDLQDRKYWRYRDWYNAHDIMLYIPNNESIDQIRVQSGKIHVKMYTTSSELGLQVLDLLTE